MMPWAGRSLPLARSINDDDDDDDDDIVILSEIAVVAVELEHFVFVELQALP